MVVGWAEGCAEHTRGRLIRGGMVAGIMTIVGR